MCISFNSSEITILSVEMTLSATGYSERHLRAATTWPNVPSPRNPPISKSVSLNEIFSASESSLPNSLLSMPNSGLSLLCSVSARRRFAGSAHEVCHRKYQKGVLRGGIVNVACTSMHAGLTFSGLYLSRVGQSGYRSKSSANGFW